MEQDSRATIKISNQKTHFTNILYHFINLMLNVLEILSRNRNFVIFEALPYLST